MLPRLANADEAASILPDDAAADSASTGWSLKAVAALPAPGDVLPKCDRQTV
jgi:hypothetical protein